MRRITPIFLLTITGLIICVPPTFYYLFKQSSESGRLSLGIFGSLTVILSIVLIIERIIVWSVDRVIDASKKSLYERHKSKVYIFETLITLTVFIYFFVLANQPTLKLTISSNVKCFAVYTGIKDENRNLITNFVAGNKSEEITENAKVIFDNKDKIDREVETFANFEYGAMTDQYVEFKVNNKTVGLRVHTVGNYQLTKQDTLKIIEQLETMKE